MIVLPLAMHMANELLSVPMAAATLALGAAAVAAAGVRARKSLDVEKLPLMGVMGAFVFAAQMINFTLPGMPGTSGHLGGGVLLAILLGPACAVVTMAAILIVQCLLFQDGGLLALGCNILNMGVVPCLLGWGVYRLILGPLRKAGAWRQYLASWAACLFGVTAGAGLVPLEAMASGVLRVPAGDFFAVMIGVHLLIGFVEGLITFAVVAYLRQTRPTCLGLPAAEQAPRERLSRRALAASMLVTAALLAGVVSWFASTHPDGLEWSYLEHKYANAESAVKEPGPFVAAINDWQSRWSVMTDYARRPAPLGQTPGPGDGQDAAQGAWPRVDGWGSLAGLVGTIITLAAVYAVARGLSRRRPAETNAQRA